MLVTGSDPAQPDSFIRKLEVSLQSGVRLVQLRTPDISPTAYPQLLTRVHHVCCSYQAQLLLNLPPWSRNCEYVSADMGLHLTSVRLLQATRSQLPIGRVIGASCHNLEQLQYAAALQLDYALLSPVLATASHPQTIPLGWEKFAALVQQIHIPVYALGGLDSSHLPIAKQHGAWGIAAIRSLWPNYWIWVIVYPQYA